MNKPDYVLRALWTATAFVAFSGVMLDAYCHGEFNTLLKEEVQDAPFPDRYLNARIEYNSNSLKLSKRQVEFIKAASDVLNSNFNTDNSDVSEFGNKRLVTASKIVDDLLVHKSPEFEKALFLVELAQNKDIDPVELAKELAFARSLDIKDNSESNKKNVKKAELGNSAYTQGSLDRGHMPAIQTDSVFEPPKFY